MVWRYEGISIYNICKAIILFLSFSESFEKFWFLRLSQPLAQGGDTQRFLELQMGANSTASLLLLQGSKGRGRTTSCQGACCLLFFPCKLWGTGCRLVWPILLQQKKGAESDEIAAMKVISKKPHGGELQWVCWRQWENLSRHQRKHAVKSSRGII